MTARRAQLICVWCGPVMVVLLAVGLLVLTGFWPPPRPTDSAEQIRSLYVDDLTRIRIGLCMMMAGVALIIPWGAAIAAQTNRIKTGTPVLTYAQIAAVGVATIIGVATPIMWGVASFRPEDISPETTRTLNDIGWFFFVFDWSPLFVWYMAVGLAIFTDRDQSPIFPRWAAWLSVWVATLSVPGGAMVLFKTGPLAFNGVLAIWIPLGVFFVWIVAMTVLTIQAINRETELGPGVQTQS
jgi:hypothetical protein